MGIKEKVRQVLQDKFYNDCRTVYEEKKALYYNAGKLNKPQINLMWRESVDSVSSRMLYRIANRIL